MTPAQCRRMKMLLHDCYGHYKQLLNKTQSPREIDEFDRCVILDSMSKCKTDVWFLRLCKAFSPSQKQRVLLRVNDSEALAMRKELREKLTALFRQTGKP